MILRRLAPLALAAAWLAASDYDNPVAPPPAWDYTVSYPDRSGVTSSTTYEVGPGRTYAEPRDVPWRDLQPGDQVLIHYRAAPYTDAVLLMARGEPTRWITVRGVKGPNGERPVFDGNNARMPTSGLNQWFDGKGMFKIHRPIGSSHASYRPGYIHLTGFEVRNVKPPSQYTNWEGQTTTWDGFSAGIYGQGFDYVAITDCDLHGNGLGLFVNSTNGDLFQSSRLLVSDNYFHNNGNVASFSEHNSYTEGIGTVYEHNWFGPILDGSYGDNIKERSAGVIFRYNYIEGGADLIALRDPESNVDHESSQLDAWGTKLVAGAYIYGNTLVTRGYLQSVVGHGDGGMGTGLQPREGHLYFYANRVISTVDNEPFWTSGYYVDPQGVTLFDLLNTRSPTTVVARNNLLYATRSTAGSVPAPLALFYWQGIADFQSNWVNDFIPVYAPVGGTNLATGTQFDGTGLGGLSEQSGDPGFVDLAGGDFRLTGSSPFHDLAATLPAAITLRGLMPTADPVIAPFVRAGSADTTPPVISAISAGTPTASAATITWTTDEAASTQVEYGPTAAYGSTTTLVASLATSHSQAITGLAAATTYHFRVLSRDAAGNLATSTDGTCTTATGSGGGSGGSGRGSGEGGGSGGCGAGGLAVLLSAGAGLAALRRRRR